MKQNAVVIGAGIVGLALARALAIKGYAVDVIERSDRSVGASIRNFGMVWPIGQPTGKMYERALRSKSIWQEISNDGVCWHDPVGSLHVAYEKDEWVVLQELYEAMVGDRLVRLLDADRTKKSLPIVKWRACWVHFTARMKSLLIPERLSGISLCIFRLNSM